MTQQPNQPNLSTSGVCPVCGAKEGERCFHVWWQAMVSLYGTDNNTVDLAHQARIDAAKKEKEKV